jgi:opacity protein-like surface antigen
MRLNANFRAILILILSTFGVCSVSQESFAEQHFLNDSITYSLSSRETSNSKKSIEPVSTKGPFAPNTHNLSLGVGQVFLLGSLSNKYENTIGPEIDYTYGVSDLFSFQSNFSYHSHSGGSFSAWNLAAGLRANLMYFDQLVPFATVGLGFFNPSYTLSNNATVSALLFGMQLGGGIDLMISNQVFFGAQLVYNNMFESSKKASDGTTQNLGGAFMSFMIHAGMTF